MDRTTLNNILKIEDSDLTLHTFLTIGRMSEKFPYSSLLHLYKAKISEKINHLTREDALRDAAVNCPDRCLLKTNIEKIQEMALISKTRQDVEESDACFETSNQHGNRTKEELVDNFLQADTATKLKAKNEQNEEFSIEKNVKNSVSEDFKIVTETMAKVYLKQGNKDKAIKIYKQLIADNPEKSIYFANQIKKIEDN
ncbi:MAG: hypothetical protein LBO06_06840 [Bacteroidales bacterium]|jgi:tetratricopeptide (TPR) repeat protein|nr:hypothetical protein [Bacteroidales bacterium]